MFVSSYNTYIQTNASEKSNKKIQSDESQGKSFSSKLLQKTSEVNYKPSTIQINYISQNRVLNNKQEIQNQQNTQEKTSLQAKDTLTKFTGSNTLVNAKSAYESNSFMFSILKKPQVALSQTPSVEERLPKEAKDAQELNMKKNMVNTYLANENYYKITA